MNTFFTVSLDKTKRSEIVLSYYLAPVILKKKSAALFVFPTEEVIPMVSLVGAIGVQAYQLVAAQEKSYLLFYQEQQLQNKLKNPRISAFLRDYEYEVTELDQVLRQVSKRIQECLLHEREFPHEMGVLLDYPIEDVKGFMKHKGKEEQYSGYWKVYDQVEKAKETFGEYDAARKELLEFVSKYSLMELPLLNEWNRNEK